MARKTSPKKPKAITLGSCRIRAVRGPRQGTTDEWYWRADLSVQGLKKRETIWTGWKTRDGARDEATLILAERGYSASAPAVHGPQDLHTVTELLDAWLDSVERRANRGEIAKSSFDVYLATTRRLHRSELGDLPLHRVTRTSLEMYVENAVKAGRTAGGIELDGTVLGAAFRWGAESKVCPALVVRFPKVRTKRAPKYTPTPEEWDRVRRELKAGWPSDLLAVQGVLGCRIGALGKLRGVDVDLARDELTLTNKGSTRTLPLLPEARTILEPRLRALSAPDARVFGEVSEVAIRSTAGRYLKRACDAAGVPYFTAHGLRRMVEKRLALAGVPIQTFAAMLGHSPAVALRAYSAVRSEDMRAAFASAGIGGAQLADNVVPMRRRA